MAARSMVRIVGGLFVAIFGLLLLGASILYVLGGQRLAKRHSIESALTDAQVAAADARHGEAMSHTLGCIGCHGKGLAGAEMFDAPPARVVAPNLSRGAGGVGAAYAAADFDRAVRFGVGPDGSALFEIMPSALYHGLSDADMADLAAYLGSLPARDAEVGKTTIRPLGRLLLGAGLVSMASPGSSADRAAAAATPTDGAVAFGRYLASVTCVECHGDRLSGGSHPAPQAPPAPSLMHVAQWQPDDLVQVFATGRVGNRELSEWMPTVDAFDHFSASEVAALHAYIVSLAADPPG